MSPLSLRYAAFSGNFGDMHVDLIGYLMGALDPHEMRAIEHQLASDEDLRRELQRLEDLLSDSLPPTTADELPPKGLVDSTLELITRHDAGSQDSPESAAGETPIGPSANSDDLTADQDSSKVAANLVFDDDVAAVDLQPMSAERIATSPQRWSWLDGALLVASAAALIAVLVPSMLRWRSDARQTLCQSQLRDLGMALVDFASRQPGQQLPAVAPTGPEAFAGVYAVRLAEAGLLDSTLQRWCPSLAVSSNDAEPFDLVNRVPTLTQLRHSDPNELKRYRRYVGGHYAYNLGVMKNEQLTTPRREGRSSFAILADHDSRADRVLPHGGRGINVLYEDGHVSFLPMEALDVVPDHPLKNHLGHIEAGVHLDDAALGASWRAPFRDSVQR